MVYAAFPPVVNPRTKIAYITAPIIGICCLLLAAFLIATAIVLSLIPIYLPRKSVSWRAPTYLLTLNYDGSLGSDGSLDSAAREAFARKIEQLLGLSEGAVRVVQGTVVTQANKRKRRGLYVIFLLKKDRNKRKHHAYFSPLSRFHRGITGQGIQRIILQFTFSQNKCNDNCRKPNFATKISQSSIVVEFTYNGVKFTLTAKIDVSVLTEYTTPPTLASDTTTITTAAIIINTAAVTTPSIAAVTTTTSTAAVTITTSTTVATTSSTTTVATTTSTAAVTIATSTTTVAMTTSTTIATTTSTTTTVSSTPSIG
ncbi:unnamed protein product [Rotaria sp. Silwood2]|nr:unnamed protein product [Rotaria sp. Silwood2]CAF2975355.1 unnamed protein product [Rotaria sp. Silwood2]CAF4069544.1 unnamed protein product [Rotaria sp. Silwood2]CAF4149717.1 unnamed protein product [Rotaria sp. Silwood2]